MINDNGFGLVARGASITRQSVTRYDRAKVAGYASVPGWTDSGSEWTTGRGEIWPSVSAWTVARVSPGRIDAPGLFQQAQKNPHMAG